MSKVAIQGAATGTGVFTLASPATNTDRVLTLPDEAGTVLTSAGVPASAMPAGSVIQVVQVVKSDTFTTTSTSFVDVTGMSVAITPSSTSSKILVLGMIGLGGPSAAAVHGKMLVNGSDLFVGDAAGSRVQANFSKINYQTESDAPTCTFMYLHSPASISAQTYKLQIMSPSGGTAAINRTGYDGNNTGYARFASTITLMEVAG